MNERQDPFDILVSMAASDRGGVPLDQPLEPGDEERAELLLRRVTSVPRAAVTTRQVRPFVRPRRLAAAAAVVVVVGAGAAVAAVWTKHPADAATVLCYSSADTEPSAIVGIVAEGGVDPVDQCAAPWTDGRLGAGRAPALVACVSDLDATVVLPGDASSCDRLGWPQAEPRTAADDVDSRVASEVADALAVCTNDPDVARTVVEQVLVDLGADGWRIELATKGGGDTCVVPVVDAAAHLVTLVAVPHVD